MTRYDKRYYDQRYRSNLLQRCFGFKPGVLPAVGRWQPQGRLLDIGCGTGRFLQEAGSHYQVFGVEFSEYAVTAAATRPGLAGRVLRADAMADLPFRAASFQVVTMLDLVEHLASQQRLFDECHRLLVSGGVLVVSTPNPTSIGRTIKGEQWFGNRDTSHVSIRAPEYWISLLRKRFGRVSVRYDGLWDAPYVGRSGWWSAPGLRQLTAMAQVIALVLPSVALQAAGWGSPRRWGENTWLFAIKDV